MAEPFLPSLDGLSTTLSGLDGPTEGLGTSKRTTALTTKLTHVLSTTYTDNDIRSTLRLLDARALVVTEESRRNLKSEAQREVIQCNARIVDDFGAVAEQLRRVGGLIERLNSTCADLRAHVVKARTESAPMLEEARVLLARKKETETREDLLNAFTKHFLIEDAERDVLTSPSEGVDERFFKSLERVKKIHADCSILLGYNSSSSTTENVEDGESSRLGLEILDQTTRTLDAAFKKLYAWIQSRFKTLDIEDPNISGSIRRALRVLSERPSLFQNCLDFFAEARQRTLAEAFQEALTGTGAAGGGTGKAIEFSTHEPLRYVGDMLAWVHSAAVSEKEALEGVFVGDEEEIARGLAEGRDSEPWARIGAGRRRSASSDSSADDTAVEEVFDGRKALSELISRNLALVCQTLQSRIDITTRTSADPVLVFKVFNLLDFYHGIFAKLLGEDSALARLIQSSQSSTLAMFESAMEEETSAAVVGMDAESGDDLTPPVFLATALTQFNDVCRARGPQMTEAELERLFAAMLRRILTACAGAASQIHDMRRSGIYKVNYMTVLKATLTGLVAQVPSAQIPLEKSTQEIHSVRIQLVEFVTSTFLEYSGLADLMQELDTRRSQNSEERKQWLVESLDEAAQRLDEFLSSALMDAQDALQGLLDRTMAKDVVAEAVDRFCIEFDELEGMLETLDTETIEDEEDAHAADTDKEAVNGPVESLRDLYPRTGAEVRALLS